MKNDKNSYVFSHLIDRPRSLMVSGELPAIPQQFAIMSRLIERFGTGVSVKHADVASYLRETNKNKPFTRYSDPMQVFLFHLEQLVLHKAIAIHHEDFEAIRARYAGNVSVRVLDDEGVCQCTGTVTEVYQYGDLVIFAVWDNDEPLAWSMVYLGEDRVQHYDKVYEIEIKEKV